MVTQQDTAPPDPFSAPAEGSQFKMADHYDDKSKTGAALMVRPKSVELGVETEFGPTDVIKGDVYVIDGDDAGAWYYDTFLFGRVLLTQLQPRIGGIVLGRVSKGEAGKGKSAPWRIEPANEDPDVRTAALAALEAEKQANDPFNGPADAS